MAAIANAANAASSASRQFAVTATAATRPAAAATATPVWTTVRGTPYDYRMPRTPARHAPAAAVLRDAGRALLAGLAAGAVCAILIAALGWQASLRGWYGLTPERPVAIGPRE